jgi:hypothetical protein
MGDTEDEGVTRFAIGDMEGGDISGGIATETGTFFLNNKPLLLALTLSLSLP